MKAVHFSHEALRNVRFIMDKQTNESVMVNRMILDNIPINRKIKKYWIKKYERLVDNNGVDYASEKFKNLKVQLLTYLSSSTRQSEIDEYCKLAGFRDNGYLRALFQLVDTQPNFALNFVKLNSYATKSTKTADEAAGETHRRLLSVKANPSVPKYLKAWLAIALHKHYDRDEYLRHLTDASATFHRLAKNHTFEQWVSYWTKWHSILCKGMMESVNYTQKVPYPEVYKDYCKADNTSLSLDRDLADLVSMHMQEDSPFSPAELDFIDNLLDDEVADYLFGLLYGMDPDWSGLFKSTSILSGLYVGQVQHIRKKGAGTDLRDIAVPNRFVQHAFRYIAARLYHVLRQLPNDATFDQDQFDQRIQNRVQNSNLYAGSVDLSKATDNFPFLWGVTIIEALQEAFAPDVNSSDPITNFEEKVKQEFAHRLWRMRKGKMVTSWSFAEAEKLVDEIKSWKLFKTASRSNWEDEGYFDRWTVGQPLGSWPSFAVLGLTHNLVVEAMAAHKGYVHSPYYILGDDIIFTNKKLRAFYIAQLQSRGIPLSLHKSYEGRLVEFAGKTFVKGSIPFYTTDQQKITFANLFDYQRSTGIRLAYNSIPHGIKLRLRQVVAPVTTISSAPDCVKQLDLNELARLSYELIQDVLLETRGSHLYGYRHKEILDQAVYYYYSLADEDNVIPDAVMHTGITLSNGKLLKLSSSQFANKDGYYQRFRPVRLPDWYREKYRPCTTSALMLSMAKAVSLSLNAVSQNYS